MLYYNTWISTCSTWQSQQQQQHLTEVWTQLMHLLIVITQLLDHEIVIESWVDRLEQCSVCIIRHLDSLVMKRYVPIDTYHHRTHPHSSLLVYLSHNFTNNLPISCFHSPSRQTRLSLWPNFRFLRQHSEIDWSPSQLLVLWLLSERSEGNQPTFGDWKMKNQMKIIYKINTKWSTKMLIVYIIEKLV